MGEEGGSAFKPRRVVGEHVNIDETKEFLLWCKQNYIRRVKMADIEVEFREDSLQPPIEEQVFAKTPAEIEAAERRNYEELLTWSST